MEDLLNQVRFSLEVGWYKLQQMIGSHAYLIVGAAALIFFCWMFLSPAAKSRR